ncbi:hypothetical protein DPMN_144493 [Dreissena polymorpha]|uniref:Uncharacterized protein n=1 Tax=Dreissena polymorpha TaxID=45954 RepID=A0A9D4GIA2_DREPO|nr:hypothetical protein DPMN_144493 [Dreissena polymorpha]
MQIELHVTVFANGRNGRPGQMNASVGLHTCPATEDVDFAASRSMKIDINVCNTADLVLRSTECSRKVTNVNQFATMVEICFQKDVNVLSDILAFVAKRVLTFAKLFQQTSYLCLIPLSVRLKNSLRSS